jgi:hypothetical protein
VVAWVAVRRWFRLINEKRQGQAGYVRYMIVLPKPVADEWVKQSRLVEVVWDPERPHELTVRLVKD